MMLSSKLFDLYPEIFLDIIKNKQNILGDKVK